MPHIIVIIAIVGFVALLMHILSLVNRVVLALERIADNIEKFQPPRVEAKVIDSN